MAQRRYGAIAALGGLLLGGLVACTVPVDDPVDNPVDNSEVEVESPPLDPATLLPPLSAPALAQSEAELANWIQSELDMAGLGKIGRLGYPFSPELEAFRQSWAAVDPDIAPFLGSWVRDWNLMPYDYLVVFPSRVPGQVCLVRYRQQETETVPFEVITTPLEFTVARVEAGQLRSALTQTSESLIRLISASPYGPDTIEFMGTVDADGSLRLYASQQPPAVDPSLDEAVQHQLKAYRCTANPL